MYNRIQTGKKINFATEGEDGFQAFFGSVSNKLTFKFIPSSSAMLFAFIKFLFAKIL